MYRCALGTSLGSRLLRQKMQLSLPRDKPNEKIDVYDCPDILAILSWNMGRPAQLQPEKRSRQGRHLLFLHTKRLEIRGSRQIFCPTLAFARFFSGSRAQLWERSIGQKFGECCKMLKKASTWPSGVSMFAFRPRLFRWVVWQYHKLTITSTLASILTKASRGQTTSTKFFSSCARRMGMLRRLRKILPNAAIRRIYVGSIRPIVECACSVWCGVPIAKLVKLQESFCRRHHVTLPPVKNDLTTIHSSYFTRLSQIWPPPIWLSCYHHHRTTLDIPLEKKRTLSLLLKNLPPSPFFSFFFCQYIFYKDGQIANRS